MLSLVSNLDNDSAGQNWGESVSLMMRGKGRLIPSLESKMERSHFRSPMEDSRRFLDLLEVHGGVDREDLAS